MPKKVKATEQIGILITHIPTGKTWDTELKAEIIKDLCENHGTGNLHAVRVKVEDLVDGFITLVSIPVKVLDESTFSFESFETE